QGSGTITTLASFTGTIRANPLAGLIMDSSGNLYGTAGQGPYGGTVFELAKGTGTITTLARTGAEPVSALIMDGSGNLYGTTANGGYGSVFELPHGIPRIFTLANFSGPNGAYPEAGLIMDSSGNLYGTTEQGGPHWSPGYNLYGFGTVFELAHGSHNITTLASFNDTDGANPRAGLIMDSSGNLYGTAAFGGNGGGIHSTSDPGDGTVFEVAKGSGMITTLASFNVFNGANPFAGLIMDSSGNLYGTTAFGGMNLSYYGPSGGTVFELAKGSGTITTLAEFNGTDGEAPEAGLIMDSSGNLYGTTLEGGVDWTGTVPGDGTVFGLSAAVAEPSFQISGFSSYSTISAGTAQTFTVTAQSGGTTDTGYTGTVHFTSSDAQAVLPATYTITAANAGVATFTATLKTAGRQSVSATDTTNIFVTGSAITTVTGAAASSLTIGRFPSPTTAGSAGYVTVTALDAYGNIATGYTGTVHFTSSDAKAVLPADFTFTPQYPSPRVFSVTLETAGTQSITATDTVTSGMTSTQSGITVNPAAASVLVVTGPSTATAGVAFSITVTAYDAYGNVATGYTGTVHFTSTDSTATRPANYTFQASDEGTHTFSGLVLKKKGNQSLKATDTLTSSLSGSLTVGDS
ncbi:MAG TPA: choice-of-anchor tandem repeat GloVer-containing protein, partial [Gemmataceae bacterium]|nr:choice-of-anchor tandem repeat GloVer-containing protein [Gemmataceae bacterium]